MAGKEIANEDLTLQITTEGVTGSIEIISVPSTKVKANNKGVYRGDLIFNVSGLVQGVCGTSTAGSNLGVTISPTAVKVKAEGLEVLRKGDKVTEVTSSGAMQPGSPSPTACTITYDVEVVDAGQTKAKAE